MESVSNRNTLNDRMEFTVFRRWFASNLDRSVTFRSADILYKQTNGMGSCVRAGQRGAFGHAVVSRTVLGQSDYGELL
jgi:hypothetical protein